MEDRGAHSLRGPAEPQALVPGRVATHEAAGLGRPLARGHFPYAVPHGQDGYGRVPSGVPQSWAPSRTASASLAPLGCSFSETMGTHLWELVGNTGQDQRCPSPERRPGPSQRPLSGPPVPESVVGGPALRTAVSSAVWPGSHQRAPLDRRRRSEAPEAQAAEARLALSLGLDSVSPTGPPEGHPSGSCPWSPPRRVPEMGLQACGPTSLRAGSEGQRLVVGTLARPGCLPCWSVSPASVGACGEGGVPGLRDLPFPPSIPVLPSASECPPRPRTSCAPPCLQPSMAPYHPNERPPSPARSPALPTPSQPPAQPSSCFLSNSEPLSCRSTWHCPPGA